MITIDKRQTWNDLEERMARTIDRLKKHIDPGIMQTVVALNAMGIYTTASCEGHLDRALAYPWIDVSLEEAESLSDQILAFVREGKREEEETQRLMQKHRELVLQAEYSLVKHLEDFYQHHPFNYDRHLSIWRFGNGKPRLQSHGAEYQTFRDPSARAEKLAEYQSEMQAFADFLKRRFFGEDATEQEYPVSQAAEILGMKHRTLNAYIDRGNIKATKRGRDLYIAREELERFKATPRKVGRPSRATATIPANFED
jgi:excisionase family DNA binding protein